MTLKASLAVLAGVVAVGAAAVEVVGKVTHPDLGEISGLAKSSDGTFYWVHNDSGDSARLFAIDAEGNVIGPSWMNLGDDDWPGHTIDNAWHFDWESIAAYEGDLYIADVGNNGNARRDLGIYRLAEPNPRAVTKARAQGLLEVVYPDQAKFPAEQWHFDCEAIFVDDGFVYLISKHREAGRIDVQEAGAKLYRMRAVRFAADAELGDGPEVSLNGSPTVSPTTAALWGSEPLPPKWPSSIHFLALSQAPPLLAIINANSTPLTVAPASMPPKAMGPRPKPTATGANTANRPGRIISRSAAAVLISTQRRVSGLALPSIKPSISRN